MAAGACAASTAATTTGFRLAISEVWVEGLLCGFEPLVLACPCSPYMSCTLAIRTLNASIVGQAALGFIACRLARAKGSGEWSPTKVEFRAGAASSRAPGSGAVGFRVVNSANSGTRPNCGFQVGRGRWAMGFQTCCRSRVLDSQHDADNTTLSALMPPWKP